MSGLDVPALIDGADITEWSDDVDVVVVGFGIGGGCAAVSAAATGARVLVLERAAVAGGTTALAGGHFYLGGGTAVQQATGHADSAEEMYKYLVAMSRDPEHDKIRAYCEGSVEHFDWLEELGVHFERTYYPEKAVIQPNTEGLMYTATGAVRAPSVVIAAGGFVMNPDMVAKFTPELAEKLFVLGNTYDDGLGIRLGVSAGAATKHMDQSFITAPVYPPAILLTGIIVNKLGQRFVAEDSYHSRTSGFVMDQPDSAAYLIVDEAHLQRPTFPLIKFIDGWETVAQMEADLGMPAGNLVATLDRYNGYAAKGEDPDFHKQPEFLAPQDHGPWAAFDLSLGKAMYSGFTVGGLATSVDGQVLREDGSVIAGLYAAGACASNIAQDGKGYSSGTQLGEGSFFGRRAGTHAAARARTP
ncbi:MAG: FAD-dependent oxidoreductase [Mycobacteriaceae bacterium]|nr:FAD-dependent oxidoreductase [Mycobacteriaceae bacterium]